MRRIWWEEEGRYVTLKVSTRALRTLSKKTLGQFLKEEGLELV